MLKWCDMKLCVCWKYVWWNNVHGGKLWLLKQCMLNYGLCWNKVCSNMSMLNWGVFEYLHVELMYVEKCVCSIMILLKNLHVKKCVDRTTTSPRKNGSKASNDEDFMCVAIKSSSSKDDNDPSSSPPTWTNVTLTQRIFLIGLRMMCFDRFWWMWSIIVVCYWTCAFVIVHNYFLCNLTTILWIWVFDIHLGSKV